MIRNHSALGFELRLPCYKILLASLYEKFPVAFFICSELKLDNFAYNWPTVDIVMQGTIPFNYTPQTILVTAHNKLQNSEKYRETCL